MTYSNGKELLASATLLNRESTLAQRPIQTAYNAENTSIYDANGNSMLFWNVNSSHNAISLYGHMELTNVPAIEYALSDYYYDARLAIFIDTTDIPNTTDNRIGYCYSTTNPNGVWLIVLTPTSTLNSIRVYDSSFSSFISSYITYSGGHFRKPTSAEIENNTIVSYIDVHQIVGSWSTYIDGRTNMGEFRIAFPINTNWNMGTTPVYARCFYVKETSNTGRDLYATVIDDTHVNYSIKAEIPTVTRNLFYQKPINYNYTSEYTAFQTIPSYGRTVESYTALFSNINGIHDEVTYIDMPYAPYVQAVDGYIITNNSTKITGTTQAIGNARVISNLFYTIPSSIALACNTEVYAYTCINYVSSTSTSYEIIAFLKNGISSNISLDTAVYIQVIESVLFSLQSGYATPAYMEDVTSTATIPFVQASSPNRDVALLETTNYGTIYTEPLSIYGGTYRTPYARIHHIYLKRVGNIAFSYTEV